MLGLKTVSAAMRSLERGRASRRLQAALREAPDDAIALHELAAADWEQGRTTAARAHLERVFKNDVAHADGPLRVWETRERRDGAAAAEAYLRWFMAERDAYLFRQIETYVEWLRTSRYLDYPLIVQLETLTLCNAACTFCQYPELTRKGDKMPDAMVHKIVDELKAMPADLPFTFTLYGVSEPFLDKRIFEHIALINRELPNAQIGLNTNGAPLTPANLDRLAELRIAWMGVSVNDYRKDEYERTMKIPFDRTLKVLDLLQERRASGRLGFNIGLTRAGDGSIEDLRFIRWARSTYPALTNNFTPQFVWVGHDPLRAGLAPAIGCSHWFEVAVRGNGKVSFCCIDGHIDHPRGDLTRENILDLYNAPAFRRLRATKLTRPEVPQCRTCTSG
jgi:hypothetical protein